MNTSISNLNLNAASALAETHRAEHRHNQDADQANIEKTGMADFHSRAHVKKTRNPRRTSSTSRLRSASQRRQKKVKKEDLSSIAQKLIEHMAADGDKEDLGDERRDSLELFFEYQTAQDLMSGKQKLENPEDQKKLDEFLKKLPAEKKQAIRQKLETRKEALEEAGGQPFKDSVKTAKALQEVFDKFAEEKKLTPEKREEFRKLLEDNEGQVAAYVIAKVLEAGFQAELTMRLTNMQQIVNSDMGQGSILGGGASHSILGAGTNSILGGGLSNNNSILNGGFMAHPRCTPPFSVTMGIVNALNQVNTAHAFAQEMWDELSNAMREPPQQNAAKMMVLLVEVPHTSMQEPSKLLKAASESLHLLPKDKFGEVCKAIHKAVDRMPAHWWPDCQSFGVSPSKNKLKHALEDKFKTTQSGTTPQKKEADGLETRLRTEAPLKARL